MQHNYTDEEIRTAWKDALSLREFLDALPARLPPLPKTLTPRPPRPEPKASQQEAIDAAFLDSRHISLWAVADSPYWEKEAPDRLALAQVYEQVRPQSAEMVELRAELDYARKTIEEKSAEIDSLKSALPERPQAQPGPWPGQQEAIDKAFCSSTRSSYTALMLTNPVDWEQQAPARLAVAHAYDAARPQAAEIAALKSQIDHLEERDRQGREELVRLRAELAALRAENLRLEKELAHKLDMGCQAAVCGPRVALDEAVRRMEAVPVGEIGKIVWDFRMVQGLSANKAAEAVRARLIAAAKGEGQLVVVNEPPKNEEQPDLSGEGEKQTEPAWIPHDGGSCPLKDEEVEEWEIEWVNGIVFTYEGLTPSRAAGWDGDIIAYRVLRWKPGFGPEAKAEPAQAQQAEAKPQLDAILKAADEVRANPHPDSKEMWERAKAIMDESQAQIQAAAKPWTPAVGDTVRLKSGGPVMTVIAVGVQVTCFYYTEQGVLKRGVIPAACLTPVNGDHPKVVVCDY